MKICGSVAVAVALLFGACGDDGGEQAAFDAAPIPFDAEVVTACTSAGGAGGTHKLYLNFESQELTAGAVNDATQNVSAPLSAAGTSPPWFDGAATRDTLIIDHARHRRRDSGAGSLRH
jgi:hypothetical protein